MLSRLLGALHNLSKRVQVRSVFLSCEAVDVLIPLLKAEVTLFATKALLVLAYLIDEQNNHVIMADEGRNSLLTSCITTCTDKCFFTKCLMNGTLTLHSLRT